ncbi:hypothetical protein [Tsuneonella sp. HG222]
MIRRMIQIYRFKLVLERNLAARKRARREGKIYIAAHVRRHT